MSPVIERTIINKLEKLDHLEQDIHEVKQLLTMLSAQKTVGQIYEENLRKMIDGEVDTKLKEMNR